MHCYSAVAGVECKLALPPRGMNKLSISGRPDKKEPDIMQVIGQLISFIWFSALWMLIIVLLT